jgi:hypothetical protein
LRLPDGITVLLLPPYSPQLNPTEYLWHHVRRHHLGKRAYEDYGDLLATSRDACGSLTPAIVQSVRACTHLEGLALS